MCIYICTHKRAYELRLIEETTKIVKNYYRETSTVIRNLQEMFVFEKRDRQRETLRRMEGLNSILPLP